MNKKRQFIAVLYDDNFCQNVYRDLRDDNRVIVVDRITKRKPNSFLGRMLYKAQFSIKLNSIISIPFKGKIWGWALDDIDWNTDTEYYIWITNPGLISISYLKKLRKKYNIKFFTCTTIPLDVNLPYNNYIREFITEMDIDYVFTSNPHNVEIFENMIFEPFQYSMLLDNVPEDIDYDLYLVADAGGRLNKFYSTFDYLMKHDVNMKYRLKGVEKNSQKFKNKIIYQSKEIPYYEVVKEVKKSNCILEVLREGYTSASLRYCEAICYNKKLLTNNKNVVNLPFYNPEYIHIFERPEDIDCDWVKERIPIDYCYDGRFSPTHLIDKIIELKEQKEG